MEFKNKDQIGVLNLNQPAPYLSDNIVAFITNKLKEENYHILVEFGAGNSTRYFLSKLTDFEIQCEFISIEYNSKWFKELVRAIKVDLKDRSISEEKIELNPWSYHKCKRFMLEDNATRFEVPFDLGRLPKAKRSFGGPFNIKMLLYRLQPGSRPMDGCYSVRIEGSIKLLLILRSEIMKDQYGESPIKHEYIEAPLEPVIQKLQTNQNIKVAFLIDGGPRSDILNSVLDLEERYTNFSPTIFLCDANRSIYIESQNRRPAGVFIQGSNRSLQGESLYTKTITGRKAKFLYGKEEILPSEFAAKELWFYQSTGEKNE
jgi:hypothetical protein